MSSPSGRVTWMFAVGTLGRDFVYTMVAMFLIVFLTETLNLSDATLWWVSGVMLAARLLDAFTDIAMGGIVDNTRTRWGPYAPWLTVGVLSSSICAVLLFTDPGLRGPGFVAWFTVVYLLWGISWTVNDIPYWSLLPTLSVDPTHRERIGSLTKIFATIGLFTAVVSVLPATHALGGDAAAWTTFVGLGAIVMISCQAVTVFGVSTPAQATRNRTRVRDLVAAVARNDQLIAISTTMILFTTGYLTTTGFGVYYFAYVYRDEGMFSPFAAVLGVAQIIGYALFPVLRRRWGRRRLFGASIALSLTGYAVFYVSPQHMLVVALAGLLLFVANSLIVVLVLVSISDCVEYGQWRTGRRNGAVTLSLQPFVNKVAGALASGIVSATLILTGINSATSPDDVTAAGLTGLKAMMLLFPAALVLASYLVYLRWYRIDDELHRRIVADLRERRELS